jgi:hypothetical protein
MTLLIGTISGKHAVLTADGLSLANPTTGAGVDSDKFQKIFPVASRTIAFVHHGLNILQGKPIGDFIGGYIEAWGTAVVSASIKDIAVELRSYAEQAAQKALEDPTNIGVVAFWIAGFGGHKAGAEFYEVCWPVSPNPTRHEGLVLGGDGEKFVHHFLSQPLGPFRPELIKQSSVNFARRYHKAIYSQAESRQEKAKQSVFGGRMHQLVVERKGWYWTLAPDKS